MTKNSFVGRWGPTGFISTRREAGVRHARSRNLMMATYKIRRDWVARRVLLGVGRKMKVIVSGWAEKYAEGEAVE